ncbi:hypothetical protein A8C56_22820 [Niabella ginsenosidivorans]|uniref:Uncharacterized protein n=1 Tax=Niabella ginsenosidivorans TaxID=1176587 RepID=A0A1A9I777_9BACT|nr:hypothetical protein [Niabella ginsenosidivorans]ANH83433.1 hypothetical protein A8C56_22820 [Niabella ginsenosidivorans]
MDVSGNKYLDFLSKQLALATTDREKKQIQWAINSLPAQQNEATMDSAQLAAYNGTFEGGLHFYVKGNNLYCQNAQKGNVIVKLQHVSNNLFILNENNQLEFKKDQSGQFSGIRWYRSDGTESFRKRKNVR